MMSKPIDCSTLVATLKKHKINAAQIAVAAQCDRLTVRKTLDPKRVNNVRPVYKEAIRKKTVELLRVMGWDGKPCDLWAEYDSVDTHADKESA